MFEKSSATSSDGMYSAGRWILAVGRNFNRSTRIFLEIDFEASLGLLAAKTSWSSEPFWNTAL